MDDLQNNSIKKAIESLKKGEMILLFDAEDREGETDFVIPAGKINTRHIYQMRKDGGGLICVAIHPRAADTLGLPYYADILRHSHSYEHVRKLAEKEGDITYDSKSSFSLWVNHRDTFTGITDRDRVLTISRLSDFVKNAMNGGKEDLSSEFRSPGHVPLLRAADGLIYERTGQTELSVVLAELADLTPVMAICEMLDGSSGLALSKTDAERYANEHGLVFLEGKDVINEYEKR